MRTGSRVTSRESRDRLLSALVLVSWASVAQGQSLRDTVETYTVDRDALARRYAVPYSPARTARFRTFYTEWLSRIAAVPYDKLDVEGRIDWHLIDNGLRRELALLDQTDRRASQMRQFLPFAVVITGLMESRRRMETIQPREAASTLAGLTKSVDSARAKVESPTGRDTSRATRIVALRAAGQIGELGKPSTTGSPSTAAMTPHSPGGPWIPGAGWIRR